MVIELNNNTLNTNSLQSRKINQIIDSEDQFYILDFIQQWQKGKKHFEFHSSGTTGVRKSINLSREQLAYSAQTTLRYIDKQHQFSNALLCINPRFIGGTMIIVRALLQNLKLIVQTPTSLPTIKNQIDLVSMVPLQVTNLINSAPESFEKINTLLIGGAVIAPKYINQLKSIDSLTTFTSYGMTETASHIALRNIKSDKGFRLIGDIETSIKNETLTLKGRATANKIVQTNDVVEFLDQSTFVFKGRKDNVINSGGYKVFPEEVESVLAKYLHCPFFITGLPDQQLGFKVILVVESTRPVDLPSKEVMELHPYQYPKSTVYLKKFVYTESDKINRTETLKTIQW